MTSLEPPSTEDGPAATGGLPGAEAVFAGPLKVVRLIGALGHGSPSTADKAALVSRTGTDPAPVGGGQGFELPTASVSTGYQSVHNGTYIRANSREGRLRVRLGQVSVVTNHSRRHCRPGISPSGSPPGPTDPNPWTLDEFHGPVEDARGWG